MFDKYYKNECFDVILAFNVLHFFKNRLRIVQKMHDLLKAWGLTHYCHSLPGTADSYKCITQRFFRSMIRIQLIPYMAFFNISELQRDIEQGGFQVTTLKSLTCNKYFKLFYGGVEKFLDQPDNMILYGISMRSTESVRHL